MLGEQKGVSANDVLGYSGKGGKNGAQPAKKALAAEWLTKYLSVGPAPANDLREDAIQVAISWSTLRRAAKEVNVVKARHGFGKGSAIVWMLPDGHPALIVDNSVLGSLDFDFGVAESEFDEHVSSYEEVWRNVDAQSRDDDGEPPVDGASRRGLV
jgi:hypothetical protein